MQVLASKLTLLIVAMEIPWVWTWSTKLVGCHLTHIFIFYVCFLQATCFLSRVLRASQIAPGPHLFALGSLAPRNLGGTLLVILRAWQSWWITGGIVWVSERFPGDLPSFFQESVGRCWMFDVWGLWGSSLAWYARIAARYSLMRSDYIVFVSTSSIFRSWKRTLPGMPLNEHMHFRGSDMLLTSFRVTVYLSHVFVFRFQVVLFMFRTCAPDSLSQSYQKPFANTW